MSFIISFWRCLNKNLFLLLFIHEVICGSIFSQPLNTWSNFFRHHYLAMLNLGDTKAKSFAKPEKCFFFICFIFLKTIRNFIAQLFRGFFYLSTSDQNHHGTQILHGFWKHFCIFPLIVRGGKKYLILLKICNFRDLIKMNSWETQIKQFKYQSEKGFLNAG